MAQFSPDFQVISKKTKKKTKKKFFAILHFDGPYEAQWALSWAPSSQSAP